MMTCILSQILMPCQKLHTILISNLSLLTSSLEGATVFSSSEPQAPLTVTKLDPWTAPFKCAQEASSISLVRALRRALPQCSVSLITVQQ